VNPRRRWSLISLAAVATGVASFVAPEEPSPVAIATPVQRARVVPATLRQQAPIGDLPARAAIGKPRGELFAARSWAPPPAPAAPQQPVAPAAPPNPYRFAGTSHHNGVRKVFLIMGDRIFEAKAGEKLEQGFRVDSVSPEAVILVYEPMDIPVTIATAFPDAPAPAAAGGSAPAQSASNRP
jgi:hypothetical protein